MYVLFLFLPPSVPKKASRFRKLIGTMSPPDDSETAEIYIEVRTFILTMET